MRGIGVNSFTVTSDDVTKLHNAKCFLYLALDKCADMFKDDAALVQNLKTSMQNLEPVALRLMKEKDDYYDRLDEVANTVKAERNIRYTVWSIYSKQLHENHGFPPGSRLTSYYSDQVGVVTGPTYLDLWNDCEMLAALDDDHFGSHIFIEGFRLKGNTVEVDLGS
jgi:hypothetical protein